MHTTCCFFYGTNWSPAANSGQRGPWSYGITNLWCSVGLHCIIDYVCHISSEKSSERTVYVIGVRILTYLKYPVPLDAHWYFVDVSVEYCCYFYYMDLYYLIVLGWEECNYKTVDRKTNGFSWASYQIRKIAGCACAGNYMERFLYHRGLAIPTCITARALRTCRDSCRYR